MPAQAPIIGAMGPRLAIVFGAVASTGCGSGLTTVQAGYAHAIAKSPEEAAVAAEAHATLVQGPVAGIAGPLTLLFGGGDTSGYAHEAHFGIGGVARGKVGANVRQIAVAPTLYFADGGQRGGPVSFYALSSYHLAQLEWLGHDSRFAFGMFSPILEGGIVVHPIWMTVSVAGEYDIRFSAAPNTGYVSFMLGFGQLRFD